MEFLYISSQEDLSWQSEGKCRQANVLLPTELAVLEEAYGRPLTEAEVEIENIRKVHDIFFPARGESATTAKAFCSQCPVELPCLEYSLANGEKFGIWGGCPYRTRRRALSARRKVRAMRGRGQEPDI